MAAQPGKDLQKELDDITGRNTKLQDHQAFVVWFIQAFMGASQEEALASLPGPAAEKGVDGVFIDSCLPCSNEAA